MTTQLQTGFRQKVYAGTGGHIVCNEGERRCVGNGEVVRGQPGLRGFVVVGRDREQCVCPAGSGHRRQTDGRSGAVRSYAGNDLAASGAVRNGMPEEFFLFLGAECGCFACCAADDNGRNACLHLAGENQVKPFKINFILDKRRDNRGCNTGKYWFFHGNTSAPSYEIPPPVVQTVEIFPAIRYNTAGIRRKESGSFENK